MTKKQIELFDYPGLTERLRDVLSSGEKIRVEEVLLRMGMKSFNRRDLRRLCEEAILRDGIPIGVTTKGLFLVTDTKSYEEARSFLVKQLLAYSKRIDGLEKAFGITETTELDEEEETA